MAEHAEDFERPPDSPAWAENALAVLSQAGGYEAMKARCKIAVALWRDEVERLRDKIEHLEALLREANEAFDEVTDTYAKELVEGEEWRTFAADEAGEGGTDE